MEIQEEDFYFVQASHIFSIFLTQVYNEAPILTHSQKGLQYLLKCYAKE